MSLMAFSSSEPALKPDSVWSMRRWLNLCPAGAPEKSVSPSGLKRLSSVRRSGSTSMTSDSSLEGPGGTDGSYGSMGMACAGAAAAAGAAACDAATGAAWIAWSTCLSAIRRRAYSPTLPACDVNWSGFCETPSTVASMMKLGVIDWPSSVRTASSASWLVIASVLSVERRALVGWLRKSVGGCSGVYFASSCTHLHARACNEKKSDH